MISMEQPATVIFFGISGSGKGTQVVLLKQLLEERDPTRGTIAVGMGALVRAFSETGTPLARRVDEVQERGTLLPSVIPAYLLARHFNETLTGAEHLLLDGVARRPIQTRMIDELVRFYGYEQLHAVVLDVSPSAARERLGERRRADDTDETISARFSWYEREVIPAVDALGECGWTIHRIDGAPAIEEVHDAVVARLGLHTS